MAEVTLHDFASDVLGPFAEIVKNGYPNKLRYDGCDGCELTYAGEELEAGEVTAILYQNDRVLLRLFND